MKKQFITFGILGIMLISGLISVSATVPQIKNADIGDQGIFEAELGRRGSDESFLTLNGKYQVRDRFVVFGGTATIGQKEGRFRGGFHGNYFVIKIPVISRTLTIFGRFNLNDDNTFQGIWIERGMHARGWITGTLTS
jgi:hypothetical protein